MMGNEKERFFDTFVAWHCLYRCFWGNGPRLVSDSQCLVYVRTNAQHDDSFGRFGYITQITTTIGGAGAWGKNCAFCLGYPLHTHGSNR